MVIGSQFRWLSPCWWQMPLHTSWRRLLFVGSSFKPDNCLVHFYGFIRDITGLMYIKILQGQRGYRVWREVELVAKLSELLDARSVSTLCGFANSVIPEACKKVCFGHAGILSGNCLALGASSQNFLIWKQDRTSAMSLHTPGIYTTQTLRLWCTAQ